LQTNLSPCPYRQVDVEGRILCNQIKTGEREVAAPSAASARSPQIDCTHLRATLNHQSSNPLTVRWGNGRTEIWHDAAPPLHSYAPLARPKTIPIISPGDCRGCTLHKSLVTPDAIPVVPKGMPAIYPYLPAVKKEQGRRWATHERRQTEIFQLHQWLQHRNTIVEEEELGAFPSPSGKNHSLGCRRATRRMDRLNQG